MMKNILTIIIAGLLLSGCKKYVDIPAPDNQVVSDAVFTTDASATGAVLALYSFYYTNAVTGTSPANSTVTAINVLGAMSADDYYNLSGAYDQFKNNAIPVTDSYNSTLWAYSYFIIYEANAIIEGLNASTGVTAATKAQLMGEAKFFRAFTYFNLVNFYGDVPLVTTTSLTTNTSLPRTSKDSVYSQIVADLKDAQSLLTATYPSAQETRANKYVATALLARVYLYMENWAAAEAQASDVLNAGTYHLEPVLNNVFVNTSKETILQLATKSGYNWYGFTFVPTTTPTYVLYNDSFEAGDQRKANWAGQILYSGQTYYYPYKYKLRTATAGNEYVVIERLAEQYLIRAEARAEQNNLTDAVTDLDSIRVRAGLPVLSDGLSQADILLAVEKERKSELFAEMGHRWMDLKRTKRADAVLGALKSTWTPTAVLYPIPLSQIQTNASLQQNDGYSK